MGQNPTKVTGIPRKIKTLYLPEFELTNSFLAGRRGEDFLDRGEVEHSPRLKVKIDS